VTRLAGTRLTTRALLVLLTVAGFGCSLRERSNPLDPKNRVSGGLLAGFNVLAGDGVVLLRWRPATQQGLDSYRIDRWSPGETPRAFAVVPPYAASAEDLTARNDSTYVYRLVARFSSGDSTMSPPDTATPGSLRIMTLVSSLPGVVGLTPDARDVLYADVASEAFDELDLDSTRGVFWMTQYERGLITSRRFETIGAGTEFNAYHPTDIAITTARGTVWAAQPELFQVARFGVTDTLGGPVTGVGPARWVESNSANSTLWIGSDDGRLFHANAPTSDTLQAWAFGGRVGPIAVDEFTDEAWVAVRNNSLFDLYRVIAGNPTPVLMKSGLFNVTDIEVEAETRSVWVSERGAAFAGNGRLSRFDRNGAVAAALGGIEPYALSVEPGTRNVWVTDLRSDRLIEVSATGAIVRRSPTLGVPYGVRVYRP